MEYTGTVLLRYSNIQSKSEGYVAFLQIDEHTEYQLYRPGVYPIDDSFFTPYDNESVVVEGYLERNEFIAVTSVSRAEMPDNPNGSSYEESV